MFQGANGKRCELCHNGVMQLQEKQETSEEWRSEGRASDRQTVEDKPLYVPATAATLRSDTTVSDRYGMAKAIAIIIAVRFFALFILGTGLSYLLAKYLQSVPAWYGVVIFALNIGIIVWIGQMVARLAPRQVIPSIAYGNAASFIFNLIQLTSLYFLTNASTRAMVPQMFLDSLFWTFTIAVTEIVVAQYFVREYGKETGSALPNR